MSGIELPGATVVLTGASSGIGRATALALADRGARLVLAARAPGPLDQARLACEARGAEALAVPTDVADAAQVEHLGERAQARFGGFDAWVNGAAVMAYGAFWDVPPDVYRRIIETNLFGSVHGARVALAHFRDRGHGVLVNVGSVYGRVTTPYVNPYIVSKFAVRGLTQALRQEVAHLDDIEVCGVLPAAVDTPIFRHAANYTGREVTALPGAIDPGRVVRAILRSLERPRHEVVVGLFGQLVAPGRALAPVPYEQLTPHAMEQLAFQDDEAPPSDGNVFEPTPELAAIDGGWRAERRWLRRLVGLAGTALAAGAVVAPALAWRRRGGIDR